ncbi:2Fe-2S iron-sulfur cluster-binding protein [Niallia sp. 03133]|uniref:2Fe-2S iron-sulfur cluster-binding protein n=1 Tax=Niallia sp. 03133 TaxID=3458060 RepID=UPI004044FF59
MHKSNLVLDIPEGETLLETLLKQKIPAPHACKIGGCGSCQVDVLEGEVDHCDFFLSEQEKQENNVILACVSRSKGECLVLDL